jgi:branched-chain amino acid aminotransferase
VQIWLDGRLLDATAARVSPLDAGWRLGDGVFSTLRAIDGQPQRLAVHVQRLVHDAAALGITGLPADRLHEAAAQVAQANAAAHRDLVLRLVATRGPVAPDAPFGAVSRTPTVAVLATPAPAPRPTTTAALVEGGRRPAAIKSTSWAWSSRAIATSRSRGADTAVLVEDGRVLEGAAANVVVRVDGADRTPPADDRILPGTTRALLLDEGIIEEGAVTVDDLARCDEVVLLSAVRGATPLVAIEDRVVGDGTAGELARRLQRVLGDAGVGPGRPAAGGRTG